MNEEPTIEVTVLDGPTEQRSESIDGDRTATRPPRQRRNWAGIKKRWINGDPVPDIAHDYGMSRTAVYHKASRSKWPKRNEPSIAVHHATTMQPIVKKAVEPIIHEQVTQMLPTISAEIRAELRDWFKGVVSTSKAIKEHIDHSLDRTKGRVEVEEIKSLALTLASIDTTVRRTFGLDTPDGRNLGVLASCRASVECPVDTAAVAAEVVAQPSVAQVEAGAVPSGNGS